MSENAILTSPSSDEREEGVLRDILDQLDHERAKRAELEAQIRQLSDELANKPSSEQSVSRHNFLAMQAQVQGFQQLVEALTSTKPAVVAARNSSIPLHVIRLLEAVPWDPKAQEHIFGTEELFEWQVFRENRWQSQLRYFPATFKSLPVIKPRSHGDVEEQPVQPKPEKRNLLVFLAGGEKGKSAPSKYGTLTDGKMTKIYNIESGFPLPENQGTWEWIGGWRVEKRTMGADDSAPRCDEQGWSYADEVAPFVADDGFLYSSAGDNAAKPSRRIRRRRWTRRRILNDYPCASERTKQYLKLLAENARLTVTLNKVSDQLLETKMTLTETEEELARAKAEIMQHAAVLKAVGIQGETATAVAAAAATNPGSEDGVNALLHDFLAKNEQVKEIGSKLSQWVHSARKMSDDSTHIVSSDEVAEAAHNADVTTTEKPNEPAAATFDWKKFGRGALLDRIKQTQLGATTSKELKKPASSNGDGAKGDEAATKESE